MIPKENFNELAKINQNQEHQFQKLRAEKRELEHKIELLKKFCILGELINEKEFIRNLR